MVSRPRIDLLLPMCEHTLASGMKLTADIPEYWMLPTSIALAGNFAVLDELVENAPIRGIEIVFPGYTAQPYVFFRLGCIDLFPRDI